MGRKELIQSVAEQAGLAQGKTRKILQKVFDGILQTLLEEGRIELRNFGVFEVKQRAPRRARNPRTGETVDVPEKSTVTFKPGQIMQQRVEALGNRNQSVAGTAGPTPDVDPAIAAGAAYRAG